MCLFFGLCLGLFVLFVLWLSDGGSGCSCLVVCLGFVLWGSVCLVGPVRVCLSVWSVLSGSVCGGGWMGGWSGVWRGGYGCSVSFCLAWVLSVGSVAVTVYVGDVFRNIR